MPVFLFPRNGVDKSKEGSDLGESCYSEYSQQYLSIFNVRSFSLNSHVGSRKGFITGTKQVLRTTTRYDVQ